MRALFGKKIIFLIIVAVFYPSISLGQSVNFSVTPSVPEPGQSVSVSISSFDVTLNQAEISWYKEGKLETKGMGLRSFNFRAEDKDTVIRVLIKSNSTSFERSFVVKPSGLDMLWEVVGSYDPPFYKGKIMPTKSSYIRVVAIPQKQNEKGFIPDASSFVYAWQKDDSNLVGQSGYGKNSFTYSPSVLDRQNSISVDVSNGSSSKSAGLTIPIRSPEIYFYEYDSAYGPLYNKAVKNNSSFNRARFNIIAEPYFAFTKNLEDSSLLLEWRLNGNIFNTPQRNAVFLNVGDGAGIVDLSFKVDNRAGLLQAIEKSLRLNVTSQ